MQEVPSGPANPGRIITARGTVTQARVVHHYSRGHDPQVPVLASPVQAIHSHRDSSLSSPRRLAWPGRRRSGSLRLGLSLSLSLSLSWASLAVA